MKNLPNLHNMLTAVCVLVTANEHAMRDGFEVTGLNPDPSSIGLDAWNAIHDFIDKHDNANALYDACGACRRSGGADVFYRITSTTHTVGHILALHNGEGKMTHAFAIPA